MKVYLVWKTYRKLSAELSIDPFGFTKLTVTFSPLFSCPTQNFFALLDPYCLLVSRVTGQGALKLFDLAWLSISYLMVMCFKFSLASREQHWQFLTDTVAMGVLCEAADTFILGITQERAHCVLTHKAQFTVMGLQDTFINVWKKEQINEIKDSMRHLDKIIHTLYCKALCAVNALSFNLSSQYVKNTVGGTVAQAKEKKHAAPQNFKHLLCQCLTWGRILFP